MYGGHDPGVCGKGQGAVALWALGWPDRAVQSVRESIVLGETLDHLPSLLHSLWFATSVYFLRRQAADVLACSARLLALGSEHGLKLYEAIGGVFHGWALIQQLDAQAGLAELRAAVATYATTAHVNLDLYRAILAEAELRAGNLEEGAAVLIQGERSTDEWWRAGYLRLRGDLLLCGPNNDRAAAERLYRQAISVAAGQQAKSLELRAATSLAMLLGEQRRRERGLCRAGSGLQLVHRRLRHDRSEGGQGLARRAARLTSVPKNRRGFCLQRARPFDPQRTCVASGGALHHEARVF